MTESLERCAVYARYSSRNQNDASIEQQVEECEAYAKENGLEIVKVYADRAFSGTTDQRPEFQRMLEESSGHGWSVLLTWKIDRFARNRYDAAFCKRALRKNGVRVLYVKEAIPEGPEGILLESVLEGVAEYYSENLAQNVRRGLYANARAGKYNGAPPLGYKVGEDGRLEIDPEKAAIVRLIYKMYAEGSGPAEIARRLNAAEAWTRGGRLWSPSTVRSTLRRDIYRGVYRYGDVVIPDGVPEIIDTATWEAVAARIARTAIGPVRRNRKRTYILSGLIRCGTCGRKMIGSVCHGSPVYRCTSYRYTGSCGESSPDAEALEDLVVRTTVEHLLAPDVVAWIAERVVELQARDEAEGPGKELRARLAEKEAAVENVLKAVESGIASNALLARLEKLEAEAVELREKIRLDAVSRPHIEADEIAFFLSQFAEGDIEDPGFREKLVSSLIHRVEFSRTKVRIWYNYADPGGGGGLDSSEASPLNELPPGDKSLKRGETVIYLDGVFIVLEIARRSRLAR